MDTETVVERFREAAFGLNDWADALDAIAELNSCNLTHLAVVEAGASPTCNLVQGASDDMIAEFVAQGGLDPAINPRTEAAINATRMQVLVDTEFTTPIQRDANPLYRGIFRQSDADCALLLPLCIPKSMAALVLMRSQKVGAFDRMERERMEAVAPAIQTAVRQALYLGTAVDNAVIATVDHLGRMGALLDADRQMLSLSAGLERIVSEGKLLTVRSGRLEGVTAKADLALERAFQAGRRGETVKVTVTGKDGKDSVVVECSPLPSRASGILSRACVLVAVTYGTTTVRPETLSAIFGLTRAEAAVAVLLAEGCRVVEIAARRCCSPATIRSQLKVIFHKTSTHGQLELVARIMRLRS